MADDVNSDSDDEIEYSGMIQPPLIKQLQTILSEYPDDGQILKEIIQNAEDAGASEMKILYDARPAVQEPSTKKAPFRKYFKGPALVVHNNAEFTEDDWKGIKMLYSSIKEFDKTKVGRFGLGFKSVFHITDYPVIISGDQLLVLDPHQDSSKVCQTMKLKKLHRYKKMNIEDCLKTFSGMFGFDQNTLESGHFQGTIFRFPLRQEETDLSDNIYDKSKVDDLFMSFKDEAPVSLLFLKCLESITLLREENESKTGDIGEKIFSVHIDETTIEAVQSARNDLRSKILGLRNDLPSKAIMNSYYLKICVEDDGLIVSKRMWKVMNMLQGKNNMSSKLQKLSNDDSLSYSPYVGLAMDMNSPLDLQGHVFCFLPLPLTEKSISGLPIHVNGFFALSQSRRFVKWPTADQIRNHTHTDKSIQWNQALVIEVLSELYSCFLQELIEESSKYKDLKVHATTVSHCIPNANVVDEHWKILIPPLVEKLKNTPIFFTFNDGGKWVQKKQAVFLRPKKIPLSDHGVESTVRKILEMYHQNTVEVDDHVWETMKLQGQQEVTPEFINRILRTSDAHTTCSNGDKFNLIRYLLSAGQYKSIEGLSLLPLQNGSFIKFCRGNTKASEIFMTPPSKMELLVGMEDRMLSTLPTDIEDMFESIIEKGIYQIRKLQEHTFIHLIKETVQKKIGRGKYPIRWKVSNTCVDFKWLRMVWKCIVNEFSQKLDRFQDLPLIPEKVDENEYQMHAMRENIMVGSVSKNISICLDMLSIKVLRDLPKYISLHPQLNNFIPAVSLTNVVNAINLLGQISSWEESVELFNNQSTEDQKIDFLQFISKESSTFGTSSFEVLKSLKLFATQERFVSIRENKKLLTRDLPVLYPSEIIKTSDKQIIYFATELGAHELQDTEIFSCVLGCILNGNLYNKKQIQDVMKYIIENKIYNISDNMFQLVQNVPFVTTETNEQKTATELFDPEDEVICYLISDRSRFPSPNIQRKGIKVLRKLGLKSRQDLTTRDIYNAAKAVHESSINDDVTVEIKKKQSAVFKILTEREELLNICIPGSDACLKNMLMDMEIVRPFQPPTSPLPNMEWFRCDHFFCKPLAVYSSDYLDLVGYVAPVFSSEEFPKLIPHLGLNRKPSLEKVLQQHSLYVVNYQEEYKSEYLLPIKRLYTFLARTCTSSVNDIEVKKMWMGDGFVEPNQIYINRGADDIDVKPYIVPLPKEFETKNDIKVLAEHLGCKKNQTPETLVSILHLLKSKYEKHTQEMDCVLFDMDIIIRILNKLKSVPEIEDMNVPIPIHSTKKSKLEFRVAKECNYCNAEWLKELAEEDGESMFFVHEDVSSDTAAKLGVPSLTENLLSETEGIQEWGQKEPLTMRIKNLLKDYKDGFAVPKELIQNADDARATKVCFLYDERENMDCRTRLIDENMISCHGPALWAYNDALFSKKDLENITKLSGATKAEDLTKVGKFGLGFCSVYNLTDVPSFITGSSMVIFDPHAKYIGKAVKKNNPGLKIDLTTTKNKILLRRMKNQFKPFNGIFGCNLNTEEPFLNGTLFRFPFRTKEQAVDSEISDKAYNEQEIISMIKLFVENAGNLLLFTQYVREIEFYHLPKESPTNKPILLHRVCREENSSKDIHILPTFGLAMKNYQQDFKKIPQQVLQTMIVTISTEMTQECHIFCDSINGNSEAKWFISWASGTTISLKMGEQMSHTAALPLASTALYLKDDAGILKCSSLKNTPKGFYKDSHIFCYLPLPVNSPLPLHINGSFAVSSNRRQLSSKTTDDKNYFENDWNEALLADAVVNAYIHLIENLGDSNIFCEQYQDLWPILNQKFQDKLYFEFYRTFYDSIIQRDSKVFCKKRRWLPLSQCFFLDPDLKNSKIGQIASEAATNYRENEQMFLISLEKVIVDNYIELFEKLPNMIQSKIISLESFYLDIFLANIDDGYWSTDMITMLVGFALDIKNKHICSKLKTTKCIPTLPNGTLKMPQELIKKNGKAASLFCDEDERFPLKEFESYRRLAVLESLGMMVDIISDDLLIERTTSVADDAKRCLKCCIEKCKCIILYIEEGTICEREVASRIRNITFLPALQKPNDWLFPWFLDESNSKYSTFSTTCSKHSSEKYTITLAKPADLYMGTCTNIVGCEKLIIDLSPFKISLYHRNALQKIGVLSSNDVPLTTVIKQLNTICQRVSPASLPGASRQLLGEVCSEIYGYLDNALKNDPQVEIESLQNVPCLFIDDIFVKPNQTAFTIPIKCSPKLYGLDRIQWKKNEFFLKKIGVKNTFEEGDVISVLKEMSELYSGVLDERSLDLACNLVQLLASVVETPVQRERYKDICIPDENGTLSPIYTLCLDDSSLLQKGKLLKFINPKIREADARKLGVQSKISGSLMQNYVHQLRPFGQKEELSSRIKRILKQYPLSEAVLKEMLQNADDAKASEVMFITDFNTYGTEKTFDATWHPLQGPALLIYNNSHFTDDDISGIQQLGRGSKGDDPTKTGQYGVGFNAVYHITDVPSFLSISPNEEKETLCVMDPNCKYAPGANENSPGARFTGLNDLRKSFPDVFHCYHENILLQSPGTVFRLPLRTKTFAEQSEISNKVVTEQIVKTLLQNLESEMEKSLLFLRNVKKITTASIENGKLCENNFTELVISDKHQKEKSAFDEYVVEKVTQFNTERKIFSTDRKDVQYDVILKRNSENDSQWCIIQTFGFNIDTEIPESVQEALDDDDLGLLPQGGVAMPSNTRALKEASAFCFLPLPCKTGLTMHVNGHFALDNESRRGLWKEDKKAYRTEWNNLLLCHVIAPMYAKALEVLQENFELSSSTKSVSRESIDKIERYHSFFPNIQSASDHYWKDFVRAVYQYISKRNLQIFLSYHFVDRINISISCFSLHEKIGDVLFVDKSKDNDNGIITIAKDLGAKLVDTPSWVCASIENAGVAIVKLNPNSFTSFLKSPLCQIKMHIEDNEQIELRMSSLKTSNHVKSCIEFCMQSENFINDIDGLPLCLLETENLVNFSTSSPVLLTSFSELIPKSKNRLLHHELHELLKDKRLGCIEEFHLPRLVELLPFHIDDGTFRHRICQWNPSQSDIPNKLWLKELWTFLRGEVGDIRDQTGIKRILHTILQWSIIPATKECIVLVHERTNEVTHELYPLEKANHIIDLSTFQTKMELSLKKLKLPVLDHDSLPIIHPLRNLVASQERVYDVLECLLEHKQLIEDCTLLDINDCNTLLDYFAGGLKQLLEMPNSRHCLTMLRKLPLFTTVHGNKINLEENRDILALPKGLPADGMNDWAEKTNKTLLRQNERLKCIFEHFSVTEQSICEVYVVHILPYFHNIPEENRIKHLQYIRDELLKKSEKYDSAQNRLINELKKTPFLPKGDGTHRVASCFFSPFNELMTLMCEDPSQFPPKPFCSMDWKTFMTSVGMKTEITTDLFLEFARHQESQGRKGFSEKLEKKSKCLVHHLLHSSHFHTLDFLQRVSKIKFIVPCIIESYYSKICSPLTDDSNHLIALRGSIKTKYLDTAWTQYRVLPYWVNSVIRGLKLSKLGVQKPSTEKTVTHIQTVCRKLGELSEKSLQEIGVEKISKIMKKFYEYSNGKKELSSEDIQTFRNIPFVFLSEMPRLFPCARFVLHLEEEYKMTPYLMPVPDVLFGFFTLFERFGATRKVSARTFANILLQIHTSSDELNPNELRTAQRAMTYFFKCLSSEKITDDQALFLLSRSKKIVEAASLVFIDSRPLKVVLENAEKYFQVMAPIEDVNDEVAIKGIKVLPEKIRPKFISTVIHTAVEFSDNKIIENETSGEINDFFRSEEFIEGVLRLVCQECHENKEDSPPDDRIRVIKENLCRTRMVFVSEMEKIYSYNNIRIFKQPCMKYFNCKEEDGCLKCMIYTNIDEENDAEKIIKNNLDNICRAIRKCTDCNFNKTTVDLTMICLNLKSRAKIETFLDEKNVSCLNSTQRDTTYQLPKPGDVIEIRWHSILDNAFIFFEPDEYVAYLSGINKRGFVEYKYAIIKKMIPGGANEISLSFLQGYLVEVEPLEEKEMKAYELYKFNRSNDLNGENIFHDFQVQVLHVHERTEEATASAPPYDNRTLNEIFKEIKERLKHAFTVKEEEIRRNICRSVMFSWHPDKHPNDVLRATTIFQYVRKIIEMLEEKKNIDEDDTEEPSNESHPWSEDLFEECNNVFENEKKNRDRYPRDTWNNRPQDTYYPDPQPFTANKWLDEAKYDMRFASHSENTQEIYCSWTCFTSYLAAEKAIIAWQYNEDSKKVNHSENLSILARFCPEGLRCLATELHNLTRGPQKMRYLEGGHRPSKAYTRDQAIKAIGLANQIIDKVDKNL